MRLKGRGRRLKLTDDVNTDYIISGRYKFRIQDPKELAKHIFEDIENEFYSKIKKGDFIIAGENFGCGSSREQAPQAIKAAGISAVIAKGYARIFYRNSFNIGLALIECDTDTVRDGDILQVDIEKGTIYNETRKIKLYGKGIPPVMMRLLKDGGVIRHFRKHGAFNF